ERRLGRMKDESTIDISKSSLRILALQNFVCFAVFFIFSHPLWSQGISKRNSSDGKSSLTRLHDLEKITMGPDDNFQVDVSSDGNSLVFTKSSHLSHQLYMKSLSSG